MEVLVIFVIGFLFSISFFISLFLNYKFSKHRTRLALIYSFIILLGYSLLAIQYWQFKQLNTLIVSFKKNTADFSFTPNYTGNYSVDLDFTNKTIKESYKHCGFSWYESTAQECDNALIFRTLNGVINQQNFSTRIHYKDWKTGDGYYGYQNYSINGPALNIFTFHGIKNKPVNMHININATADELQSTKAIIVVGPKNDDNLIPQELILFTIFCLPLFFSVISTLFTRILQKIRSQKRF